MCHVSVLQSPAKQPTAAPAPVPELPGAARRIHTHGGQVPGTLHYCKHNSGNKQQQQVHFFPKLRLDLVSSYLEL